MRAVDELGFTNEKLFDIWKKNKGGVNPKSEKMKKIIEVSTMKCKLCILSIFYTTFYAIFINIIFQVVAEVRQDEVPHLCHPGIHHYISTTMLTSFLYTYLDLSGNIYQLSDSSSEGTVVNRSIPRTYRTVVLRESMINDHG